ncbi:TetR/AcrR family transcriptional regulator [Streptomyces sp. NPDC002814]
MPHSGNRGGHGGEGTTAAPAREPGATARRRLEPQERREAILHAARELFSSRPYAGVSVADVARAAGVSPPLVVFYYGSKRALYLAVIETAADSIRHGLRALPGPPSPQRLAAGVRFYAEYARAHRAGFLSLLRGGPRGRPAGGRRRVRAVAGRDGRADAGGPRVRGRRRR